jgi:uncharacterized Zn finger protein
MKTLQDPWKNNPRSYRDATEIKAKCPDCLACHSLLLTPFTRPNNPTWLFHCNHCGTEYPAVVAVNLEAWRATA